MIMTTMDTLMVMRMATELSPVHMAMHAPTGDSKIVAESYYDEYRRGRREALGEHEYQAEIRR
jgi:hypothetical protein